MYQKDQIRVKIEEAIEKYKSGIDLSTKTTAELLESINIYHQELEYQNDELKRTVLKLEESETKYLDLFENAPLAYVIFDYEMKIIEANISFCDLMRVSKQEAYKKSITSFIHREDQDKLYFFLRNLIQTGMPGELEIRASNGIQNLDLVFSASLEVRGEKRSIRCALIDRTKETRFLEEITLREERLEQVTDLSNEMIWETEGSGILNYANRAFRENLGYSAEELISKVNIIDLLPEEDRQEIAGQLRLQANTTRTVRKYQHKLMRKSGEVLWVQSEYLPVFSGEGEIVGYRGICRDISDVKSKIHDLMLAEEAANEMAKMKTLFLSSMSHEIRNPLVSIIGASEMLLEDLSGDAGHAGMVEMIFKSSVRLRDTVSMILNLNRFEEVYSNNKSQTVDLRKLLEEIIEIFTPFAKRKGITLSLVCADSPVHIRTSEVVFLSVINNLVNNAVKYTEDGNVEIHLRKEPGAVLIEVADTGVGISKEAQGTIWDAFRQEDGGHSYNNDSSGFGLSLVKKYVELMGAEIFLESEKGVGSRFILRIPA